MKKWMMTGGWFPTLGNHHIPVFQAIILYEETSISSRCLLVAQARRREPEAEAPGEAAEAVEAVEAVEEEVEVGPLNPGCD